MALSCDKDEVKDKVVNDVNLFPFLPGSVLFNSLVHGFNAKIGVNLVSKKRKSMQMSWTRLVMIGLLFCGCFSGVYANQV